MLSCFWSLLTCEDLRFTYFSNSLRNTISAETLKVLKNSTFYQLLHPNELQFARKDLQHFLSVKPLNSTLTRCRIRNFYKNDASKNLSKDWIVFDVVMAVISEQLVLAFFHFDKGFDSLEQNLSSCGEEKEMTLHQIYAMVEEVKQSCKFAQYHNKIPTIIEPIVGPCVNRILHVLRRRDLTLMFALPTLSFQKTSGLSVTELSQSSTRFFLNPETHHILNKLEKVEFRAESCWKRSIRTQSRLVIASGQEIRLDTIIIPYKSVLFAFSQPEFSSHFKESRKRKISASDDVSMCESSLRNNLIVKRKYGNLPNLLPVTIRTSSPGKGKYSSLTNHLTSPPQTTYSLSREELEKTNVSNPHKNQCLSTTLFPTTFSVTTSASFGPSPRPPIKSYHHLIYKNYVVQKSQPEVVPSHFETPCQTQNKVRNHTVIPNNGTGSPFLLKPYPTPPMTLSCFPKTSPSHFQQTSRFTWVENLPSHPRKWCVRCKRNKVFSLQEEKGLCQYCLHPSIPDSRIHSNNTEPYSLYTNVFHCSFPELVTTSPSQNSH